MTLDDLPQIFGIFLFFLDWFGIGLLVVPLLVALARAWALLRKGRTWFAWVGGLTSILALWVLVVGWLFISLMFAGTDGVGPGPHTMWILFSAPALLFEFLVFSGLFVGMRMIRRRRTIATPHAVEDDP